MDKAHQKSCMPDSDHRMPERITAHIRSLIESGSEAIAAQYRRPPPSSISLRFSDWDPLGEDSSFQVAKGLVRKFGNRILWKVTYRCAAHCQFCTRHRQIGLAEGDLSEADIAKALAYLSENPAESSVSEVPGRPAGGPCSPPTKRSPTHQKRPWRSWRSSSECSA